MGLLLSVQGLSKQFGPKPLFSDLTMDMRVGDRVGLIGPNGSGKSTLLKLLAGRENPDSGIRSVPRNTRIGYLEQNDVFAAGLTVQQAVVAALADEPLEDYERETQAAITLTQVGFTDFEQQASALSGGWRKRLAIACALALKPDLLLMDEPTNHLDLPGIRWLERFLRSCSFAYLVATHDRTFLRAVADEVLEVSRKFPGGSFRAPGNYDDFVEKREAFLEGQAKQQEAVANQVRRETEWLGRKAAARTRKASSRIDDAMARRGELAELQYRNAAAGAAGIDFVSTGRQSRKLLAAKDISKGIAGKPLFSKIDLLLGPGTKLGLLGANGSGKSTLLKVLAGELEADTGTIQRAENLRAVMFEQGRAKLNQNVSLKDALCPNGDTVMFGERPLHVVAWARMFLFQQEQLPVEVSKLSGGEQARLRIAQLMTQPADLLLLDEPTNDLDIPALEVLEENLAEFSGAVVIVSHDRTLLDRLCTEVIGLDSQGGSAIYSSVDQWLNAYEAAETARKPAPVVSKEPVIRQVKAKPAKLSFKDQQEMDKMEATILAAEQAVKECEVEVENASGAGHITLTNACKALENAQKEVERLYARWAELEEKVKG